MNSPDEKDVQLPRKVLIAVDADTLKDILDLPDGVCVKAVEHNLEHDQFWFLVEGPGLPAYFGIRYKGGPIIAVPPQYRSRTVHELTRLGNEKVKP